MTTQNTHTLVDCGCKAKVYSDGSGVDIEYCDLHYAAPVLLKACQFALSVQKSAGLYDTSDRLNAKQLEAAIKKAGVK